MKLDQTSDFGKRVMDRLRNDQVIWLTTVRPDGIPQPNPVWFLLEGETIIIFSQPEAKKVAHIRANPKVALNFNTNEDGDDVVVITGEAVIESGTVTVTGNEAYLEKYRVGLQSIGQTPEGMAQAYGTVIRVTPKHIRGM